jgi:hypothetical protein
VDIWRKRIETTPPGLLSTPEWYKIVSWNLLKMVLTNVSITWARHVIMDRFKRVHWFLWSFTFVKVTDLSRNHIMSSLIKSTIFWDATLCSLAGIYQRFRVMYCLHFKGQRVTNRALLATFLLISCISHSLAPKVGAGCCSEMLVEF